MKKQLTLALFLLTGGLALPASAQGRGHYRGHEHTEVFISGYRSCGTPIYAKRVHCGHHYRVLPLVGCELRSYLERRRHIAAQRAAIQRQLARERYQRARVRGGYGYGHSDYRRPVGRCR